MLPKTVQIPESFPVKCVEKINTRPRSFRSLGSASSRALKAGVSLFLEALYLLALFAGCYLLTHSHWLVQ